MKTKEHEANLKQTNQEAFNLRLRVNKNVKMKCGLL